MPVTIKGIQELRQRYAALDTGKLLYPIMTAAVLDAKSRIAKYPPSGPGNSPIQQRWYERGYGSRWRTKAGVHGRKTSEFLGRSWTTAVSPSGLRGVVGTRVSYAQYVQDRDKQAAFHKRAGWTTVQDVAEKYGPLIVQKITAAIQRLIG